MNEKRYRLLSADQTYIDSADAGNFGGNRRLRIYGRLDCSSARRALSRGYARHRVFFADEACAVAAGYRPCGVCMRAEYAHWRSATIGQVSSQGPPSPEELRRATAEVMLGAALQDRMDTALAPGQVAVHETPRGSEQAGSGPRPRH